MTELKDNSGHISRSLRLMGIRLERTEIELVIASYELIKEKNDQATLKDITEMESSIKEQLK